MLSLQIKNYTFTKLSIKNEINSIENLKLNPSYSLSLENPDGEGNVKLGIEIKSEKEELVIFAEMIAYFEKTSAYKSDNQMNIQELTDQMYPYLEMAVGNLTSLAMLPRINIPKLII